MGKLTEKEKESIKALINGMEPEELEVVKEILAEKSSASIKIKPAAEIPAFEMVIVNSPKGTPTVFHSKDEFVKFVKDNHDYITSFYGYLNGVPFKKEYDEIFDFINK